MCTLSAACPGNYYANPSNVCTTNITGCTNQLNGTTCTSCANGYLI